MYRVDSTIAEEFISHEHILQSMDDAREAAQNMDVVRQIVDKAALGGGLSHLEAATLLECSDGEMLERIFKIAGEIRDRIYGNRIVMFAPLYLSNHCINSCTYCTFHTNNKQINRRKLSQEQIKQEVVALADMGHKRLALELGEHPLHAPLEYLLESIKTIYSTHHKNGAIRRVNVNIAATTVENYERLRDAGIGTYILFQETYNKECYKKFHPRGPKSDYAYHTEAMDRAMAGGIDDVGLGVLFGLGAYLYDFIGLLMHAEHLEASYGVGPHTVSIPRICAGDDIELSEFGEAIDDATFKKIVAILRITLPYTGMIISTREPQKMRGELLKLGITQLSGGSKTSVGGYTMQTPEHETPTEDTEQFEINDTRTLEEITSWLLDNNHIPSFCTACYRRGRTGEDFMSMVKDGKIVKCCAANAVTTLKEYLIDYASLETKLKGLRMIESEVLKLDDKVRELTKSNLVRVEKGERDLTI